VERPTQDDHWRDLRWVPDLETVRGDGKGTLAESALSGRNPLVFAELTLTSGSLEGRSPLIPGFANVECGFIPAAVVANFVPLHKQALTDRVVFVTDPAPSLTFVLTPRAGGQAKRIELKPMRKTVAIEVCNENTTGQVTQNDSSHFAAFYDLIDRQIAPADKLVPTPLGVVVVRPQDPPAFCPPAFSYRRS
jgi:hypothetical protein